ncbi:hypothetical protein Tco_0318043 [Tanacetum coccineum]
MDMSSFPRMLQFKRKMLPHAQLLRWSNRCHFARNYPNKKISQALIQALNQVEPIDVSDLESFYSLDDEPSDSVLCKIAYSDFSSDDEPVQGCSPHSKHLLTMLQWFIPHHQWTRWLTTTGKGTYVLVMFRRPGSFLPPRAVNDDGSVMYHAPFKLLWNFLALGVFWLQGRLRDCYHSLGEYRQLQIQQSISPEAFMSIIYLEFIGSPWEHTTHAREEFLKMKCCSFQKKDLEKHYDHMSQRFYYLNGVDDVNLKTGKRLGTACDDKYLQIKCKDKSSCDCTDPGLNQVEPVDVSDLELLYSLDDEPSDSVLCTIAYSYFSSDDDSDSDSLESDSDFGVHIINPIPHVLPIQEDSPLPLAKIHLLTDAYAKYILVIAFFDTGSSVSILNPNILLDHYWKPYHQNFMAANGEKFVIDKISVPINIQLFPKCIIKRRLLGSSSHGKELLVGFDILHKLPNLRWTGEGLHYRSFFNPWTAMHRLFVASITPPRGSCADL